MNRLTERKISYPSCDKKGNLTQVDYIKIKDKKLAEEKLCQLEDIEEEIGIDLITLFKALKNGVWTNQEQYYGDDKQGKIRFFKVRLLLEKKQSVAFIIQCGKAKKL